MATCTDAVLVALDAVRADVVAWQEVVCRPSGKRAQREQHAARHLRGPRPRTGSRNTGVHTTSPRDCPPRLHSGAMLAEDFEDELTCPVCLMLFTDPRTLP